jgi:hypothetical protein
MNAMKTYEKLLEHFARDLRTASDLATPNVEDTLEMRAAIVGFSYNAPTEQWAHGHYEYVSQHALEDPDRPSNEKAFHALCLGYLLGLFQSQKITEHEFSGAEAQLNGFLLLKAGAIPGD